MDLIFPLGGIITSDDELSPQHLALFTESFRYSRRGSLLRKPDCKQAGNPKVSTEDPESLPAQGSMTTWRPGEQRKGSPPALSLVYRCPGTLPTAPPLHPGLQWGNRAQPSLAKPVWCPGGKGGGTAMPPAQGANEPASTFQGDFVGSQFILIES